MPEGVSHLNQLGQTVEFPTYIIKKAVSDVGR